MCLFIFGLESAKQIIYVFIVDLKIKRLLVKICGKKSQRERVTGTPGLFQISRCERCRCGANREVYCSVSDCPAPHCVNPTYDSHHCCPVCRDGRSPSPFVFLLLWMINQSRVYLDVVFLKIFKWIKRTLRPFKDLVLITEHHNPRTHQK